MRRADRAYQSGDFAAAIRHYDAARSAIGEEYDDEGEERWTEAKRAVYDTTRCPRALSQLALGAPAQGQDDYAWNLAIDQANYACNESEKAVAAFLMGDMLQAALRLSESGARTFPAPFAGRDLPDDVRDFALIDGELPLAADLEEAGHYVRALAQLRHGLSVRCGEARGIAWTRRGQHRPIDVQVMALDEEPELLPPFEGNQRDALATIRCVYPPAIPPEQQGFGDGMNSQAFLLRREEEGRVSVRGSYPDFPDLDCWTSVVQNDVANFAMPGRGLYSFVRSSGFTESGGPELIIVTTILCDVQRRRCRSLPTEIRQGDYIFDDEDLDAEAVYRRRDWRTRLTVRNGRVNLSSLRGAPLELAAYRRGVRLDEFFSSPEIEYSIAALTLEPNASVTENCPVIIADPDGRTNVRPEPGTSAVPSATLESGTVVTVAERRGRWWRISSPQTGWVWGPNTSSRCPAP